MTRHYDSSKTIKSQMVVGYNFIAINSDLRYIQWLINFTYYSIFLYATVIIFSSLLFNLTESIDPIIK